MNFAGEWILKEQEGYEDFMKLMGVPDQYIQAGKNAPVSLVIEEEGDSFSIQTSTGPQSWTDRFQVGKPATITGPGRRQMETVVRREGNKLVGEYTVQNANIIGCRELDGDTLYDILSVANLTFKRTFIRK